MKAGIQQIGLGASSYYVAINPKYQVGDLVKACYTFYDYYYPHEDEDELFYPWNGIIVDVYYDEHYFGDDAIYDVLCTDGTQRLFAEWELMLIQR